MRIIDTVETLSTIWEQAATQQAPPTLREALIALVAAAVIVQWRGSWRYARHVITLAHEGGHALVAKLSGRSVAGVKLHSDASGVTVSSGSRTGPGMMATAFAGYPAPAVIAAVGGVLVTHGRALAALWSAALLLAVLMLLIRNLYGALVTVTTAALVFAVSWYLPVPVQNLFVLLVMWFLALGSVRPVFDLQRERRRTRSRTSDADQLARLTGLPGIVWVTVFLVINLAAVGYLVWSLLLTQ